MMKPRGMVVVRVADTGEVLHEGLESMYSWYRRCGYFEYDVVLEPGCSTPSSERAEPLRKRIVTP